MESKEEWVRACLHAIAQREPRIGAETAMIEIYTEFSPFVRNYVRRVWGMDADGLEEVVQDTLHEVWKWPERFRGEAKFSTWLLGIARHKAIDMLRKSRPDHEPLDEGLPDDDARSIPDKVLDEQILRAFRDCMEQLVKSGKMSMTHHEILYLTYVKDLTAAEAAEVCGCPTNTALTRLFHARKRIARCLTQRLGGDPRDA